MTLLKDKMWYKMCRGTTVFIIMLMILHHHIGEAKGAADAPRKSNTEVSQARDWTAIALIPKLRHSRHLDNWPHSITTAYTGKLSVKDNHKPMFKNCGSYKPYLKEQQPAGTFVLTVNAVDIDPPENGGTVTYTFVTTQGEKGRFYVDPSSGNITTADEFDHDEPSREKEVYITVRASDNGQQSLDDTCTIKIVIVDINDNPPVFDKVSYSESVPQDLSAGREVMRISATDIDDGNNSIVHYSLDSSSPDQQYFYIDPYNGVIFLNKTIDKQPGYKYRLNAIVKDLGTPALQSSIGLDIQVVESNKKSPEFIDPPPPILLPENFNDFDKPIATIRARSNIDKEKKLQFELVQGQTEQTNKYHTFLLEPEDDIAYIKLATHLDYEKITEYTLTVRVQNNYKLAAETLIYINVDDVNDNIPIFSEITQGKVLENEPAGTQVMQVRAFDADGTAPNNQITYELGDPSDPFAIDPITGNITTLQMFDREKQTFYNIKIIAKDNASSALFPGKRNSGSQSFLIEIADKNDNAPKFVKSTYIAESIAENANVNELVTQVEAKDVDTASRIYYSIVAGNINDAFSIREITGEIRVANELDYEKIENYSLDVRAFDGIYEDYCKVIINLENLNDNPPVFVAKYNTTIEEERLYDGCIVRVEAYDPDIKDRKANQKIVYGFVKSEQMDFLQIDPDGCLRLTKPLDRDPPTGSAQWQIFIVAADHGGKPDSLTSTTEVILELDDINDNAPFLTNAQPVVWYENELPGRIHELQAKDNDSPRNGPPFTFSVSSDVEAEIRDRFRVEGEYLVATFAFDREQRKEYLVPITITDSGLPQQRGVSILRVIIGDRNDNPMEPGHSNIFAYTYNGMSPDMEIGRVYVKDPDDWDTGDKKFSILNKNNNFDVSFITGMITMRQGTPPGIYQLRFNVTEVSPPLIKFHWVEATVNITVKEIPEIAVDNSGSIRILNCTAENFIIPEVDGFSKKDKLHRRLAKLYNTSVDNVDLFTVSNRQTVKDLFLDIFFSAHGSPYYPRAKMNTMAMTIHENIEDILHVPVYMIGINECMIEKEQCLDSCRNILQKSNVPLPVFTNTTSFIGLSVNFESVCKCPLNGSNITDCLNGGTLVGSSCECLQDFNGPRCEITSIGFSGRGWAVYDPPPACDPNQYSFTIQAQAHNGLIFYAGPLSFNPLLPIPDFMAIEIQDGYIYLISNYGTGTSKVGHTEVKITDGQAHLIEINTNRMSLEMFVDKCTLSTCMSLTAPVGRNQFLNTNGAIYLGGLPSSVELQELGKLYNWTHIPSSTPLHGCISNFTINKDHLNLGQPALSKNVDIACNNSAFTAVAFGVDNNFLIAVLVCIAILIVLLLAVVVHRRRADAWAEKELDDIRENIIAYEDEGGGEGDAGYDLHVLRQMYDGPPPDGDNFIHSAGLVGANPDISGFLDDKKEVMDRDPDAVNPFDDVRHYAYEGDGNTSGSLSSLASCTDDGDLKFNYLSTFGPRFRKLADLYGDSDDDRPHEESWC